MSQPHPRPEQRAHCVRACMSVCVLEREAALRLPSEMYAHLNCEDHLQVIVICNFAGVSNLLCFL